MTVERGRKVAAILVRHVDGLAQVLVFAHPLDNGGTMVQLPAGTVETDETPARAAVRELREETGVEAHVEALAGECDKERDGERDGESRHRWVSRLEAPDGLPDVWDSACDCGVPIRCHWLPLRTARIVDAQQHWLDLAR